MLLKKGKLYDMNTAAGKGGVDMSACGCTPAVSPVGGIFKDNWFLLLLLLFILLAAGPACGLDNKYFFVIILAIIAFGGFGRVFG